MQQTYTVMPGDSVSGISKKFFGDFSMTNAISQLNNITNPDLIYPGQILKIPDVQDAVVISEDEDKAKKKSKTWMWLILLGVAAGVGYTYYKKKNKGAKPASEKE